MNTQNTNEEDGATERNRTWESNHITITKAMAKLVRKYERVPYTTEIAEMTGLSRKTVHLHQKEFGKEKLIREEVGQFRFMANRVLGKLMELSMDGNVRAAKLSLEIMGVIGKYAKENLEEGKEPGANAPE